MRVPELTPTKPTPPPAMQRTRGGGQKGGGHSSLVCTGTHHLTLTDQRPSNTAFCSTHLSKSQSFISMKTEDCYKSYSGLQQEERNQRSGQKDPSHHSSLSEIIRSKKSVVLSSVGRYKCYGPIGLSSGVTSSRKAPWTAPHQSPPPMMVQSVSTLGCWAHSPLSISHTEP